MAWTDPNLVSWDVGDALTSADMKTYVRDNLLALKNPPTNVHTGTSVYTTTSGVFVDIDATTFNTTIDTTGGDVLIILQGVFHVNALAQYLFVNFEVDGSLVASNSAWFRMGLNASYDKRAGTIIRLVEGLAVGSHTIKTKWLVTGGATATLGNTGHDLQFIVRELS